MVRLVRQDVIERYRGRWIAVDKSGEVVADADALGSLFDQLSKSGAAGTTIQRVPGLDEPLFVGLS